MGDYTRWKKNRLQEIKNKTHFIHVQLVLLESYLAEISKKD